MDKEKVIAAITSLLSDADEEKLRRVVAFVCGDTPGVRAQELPEAMPTKKRKAGGRDGSGGGAIKRSFVSLYGEGKINVELEELKERIRDNGKHFAKVEELRSNLRKSPTVYREHSDGTWSLVVPPNVAPIRAVQ